jgi:hypothetical protein
MRTRWLVLAAAAALGLPLGPALAADTKSDPKAAKAEPKKGPLIEYQKSYAAALEEAKARGCVIFATFHIDH